MGTCWNCGVEITLKEEETRCDNCGKITRYWCNNCAQPFDVENKDQEKEKECKWCGSFNCPKCNVCGVTCESKKHKQKIIETFNKIFPSKKLEDFSLLSNLAQEIIDYFEEIKMGKKRRNCEFGVPISYAKNRIKGYLVRMEGFRTKDEEDMKEFENRRDIISDSEIGQEFTIKNIKEAGSYGQEWRDVFNLCVCLGELEYQRKQFTTKEGLEIEYDSWTRIEKDICPSLNNKDLIIKYCPKCNKIFSREKICCDNCSYTKGGKVHNKGEYYELIEKISNVDTCKLKRGEFEENG